MVAIQCPKENKGVGMLAGGPYFINENYKDSAKGTKPEGSEIKEHLSQPDPYNPASACGREGGFGNVRWRGENKK